MQRKSKRITMIVIILFKFGISKKTNFTRGLLKVIQLHLKNIGTIKNWMLNYRYFLYTLNNGNILFDIIIIIISVLIMIGM